MAYPGSSGIPGAVKIIPASAFRHYSQQQHQQHQSRSGDAGQQHYGEPNDTYFNYDQVGILILIFESYSKLEIA